MRNAPLQIILRRRKLSNSEYSPPLCLSVVWRLLHPTLCLSLNSYEHLEIFPHSNNQHLWAGERQSESIKISCHKVFDLLGVWDCNFRQNHFQSGLVWGEGGGGAVQLPHHPDQVNQVHIQPKEEKLTKAWDSFQFQFTFTGCRAGQYWTEWWAVF